MTIDVKALSNIELVDLIKQTEAQDGKYREDNKIEFFDAPPNPGPNPKQKDIIEAWVDPFYKTFTFTGGERSGKTTILTLIGLSTLFGEFPWDNIESRKGKPTKLSHLFNHNYPRKVRYIGQDWKEHIQEVVIPELRKWWPEGRKLKTKSNGIITEAEWIDEKTGSALYILSNNQDPAVHRGWHGDLILYDEPPKRAIYIANARGLVDRQGREFIAATLLIEPWIHQDIINKRLPDGKPDPTVFNAHIESRENIGYGITQEGLDQYASKMTEEERESHLLGVPSYMRGLVYPRFSRKKHLRERFQIPLDWIVDIAIDIHPRENQAVLFVATSPRNERYACFEIWEHGDGTWVGEQIIRVIKQNSLRVGHIIVDPLAKGDKNNPNTTFDKIDTVLYRYGYVLDTATKDKQSGIIEVKNHLVGPNNEPSLFFFDDMVRTIYEIEGYMYDEESQKPQDKDDHMMENLYRTCMLDTQWYEMEVEDEDMPPPSRSTVNKHTGY